MYSQEYLKVVNEAGFEGFRILIFASDLAGEKLPKESAFHVDLPFRLNLLASFVLSDILHGAECSLRPYAVNQQEVDEALTWAEGEILDAFMKPNHMVHLVLDLRRVGERFAKIERRQRKLPLIFITGEFFANLAHNDANYNLRRFITDEGCEVLPGVFTQRTLYDNWRRIQKARAGIRYSKTTREHARWRQMLYRQEFSNKVIYLYWALFRLAIQPERYGCRAEPLDFEHLADLARDYYHPEIFGGEGHLEVAEAIHYAGTVDGFISVKPFGCMPSSGVSDGVQARILSIYPSLEFLSIETSGDNEVSI